MSTYPVESRHTTSNANQPRLRRPDGSPIRAVVVDDEDSLTDLLSMALRYEGWDVRLASDGQKALSVVREFRPDIIVLDIMLPDIDGLQVLQRLRADGNQTPILFLTAKDSVDDRIAGLTVGGDDYVTKPFSLEELVARLRGLIRRSGMTVDDSADSHIEVGDLELDEDSYEVRRDGELIDLTATEFELLRYLMRNARRVVSKMQILDRVWSYDFGGKSSVVEIYISYLRKKIDAGRPPDDPHRARRRIHPEANAMKLRLGRAPWTLRRRLVVSVVALFTLLSIVVGGVSVLVLYGNLSAPDRPAARALRELLRPEEQSQWWRPGGQRARARIDHGDLHPGHRHHRSTHGRIWFR